MSKCDKKHNAELNIDFCGLQFNTPLVLLSGCVGFGNEYTCIEGFSHKEVGAVCLKGITLEPRLGNRPHRVFETPCGMLNAIGLQNPGIEKFISQILPSLDFSETRYIANISGSTIQEYEQLATRLDDSPIDAVEINISCPNIQKGGVEFGNIPEMSAKVVEVCRRATTKPLITKLSPNQTNIALNAKMCIDSGSDAFSVINTVAGMAVNTKTRKPIIGNIRGGLSGPAIKPIALLKVKEVYEICKPHNIPILGQGGAVNAQDVIEFSIVGASAIGIGTGLFYEPLICQKINQELREYLDLHNLDLSQLTGSLNID